MPPTPVERQPGEWVSPITSEIITAAVGERGVHGAACHPPCHGSTARSLARSRLTHPSSHAYPPTRLQTKRLGAVCFAPNGDLLWLEGRPSEKGRQVLVRRCATAAGATVPAPG